MAETLNQERTMLTVKVSKKGLVVIPKDIRERHGIRPGDKVRFIDLGDVISIVPVSEDPIAKGLGMLKGGPSLTEALLEERRWELEGEERGLQQPEERRGGCRCRS